MIAKRSLSLAGHRTSLALEPEFWAAAERLAAVRGQSLSAFVLDVDRARGARNLASAVRVAVLAALTGAAAAATGGTRPGDFPPQALELSEKSNRFGGS